MVHCSLGQLPDTFVKLRTLERLSIRHCTVLSVLPDSFGSLVGLKTLEIVNCSVHQLPETFGDLTALERFEHSSMLCSDSFANFAWEPAKA